MSTSRQTPLRDITEIVMGQAPSGADCNKDGRGTVFVKAGEFDERRPLVREWTSNPLKLARSGDVLVCVVGATAGKINEAIDCAIGRSVAAVRPAVSKLVSSYLYHFLLTQVLRLRAKSQGLAQGVITREMLQEIAIPLPPLAEQRRIAEVLDRAEALRAERRAALAQLDTLTQAIFVDLFGDPGENSKGWPVRRVSDYVAEFQGGKSIDSESGESIVTRNRVLKVSAVTGMKFLAHESKPVPDSYSPPPDHFARPGDLLFSRANTMDLVGAVAYVQTTPPNVLLPDKLWRFVWREPLLVHPLFVWSLFQTAAIRREIGRRATGTSGSMKNISQEKVFGISTILPPLSLQREFACRVAVVEKLRTAHRVSLAEMDALFASLQHRAFRGEL